MAAHDPRLEPDHTDASILLGLVDCWEADTDLFLDQLCHVVIEGKISFWKATEYFDLRAGDLAKIRGLIREAGALS